MPNDQKLIHPVIAPKQERDNTSVKKARDGAMTFMVWSVAGTVLAACSFSFNRKKSADSVDSSDGDGEGIVREGPVPNAPLYIEGDGTEGYQESTGATSDRLLGRTDANGEGVSLATLVSGDVVFADVNGAHDFATARTLSGVWKSLPYDGSGDLLISPLTDLLARQLDVNPDADIQGMLNQIFGVDSGITLSDIEDPDNYNPVDLDSDGVSVARKLISVASIVRTESSTTNLETGDDLAAAFTDLTTQLSGYSSRLTDNDPANDGNLNGINDGVQGVLTDAADRPIVHNPNDGNPVSIREDTPTALPSSGAESLFGFQDPLGDDSLVGIYIQDQSVDDNIAVRFGTTDSSDALADATTRGTPPEGFAPMRIIDGETFYYVSAINFGRLILSPNANFDTASLEADNLPAIRFYVHDGGHATIDNGVATLGGQDTTALDGVVGMLRVQVVAVNDVPVITPSGSQETLTEGTFPNTPTNTGYSYTARDADSGGTPVLSVSGDTRFQIDASGNLQIVANSTFDYETPADRSIQLTISASNVGGGQPATAAVTIMFENANDNTPEIAESGRQNTLTAGTFSSATDTGLSYTASDDDGGTSVLTLSGDNRFQLDASGNLQIKMGSTFNYDTLADRSISLTIMAADSSEGSGSQTTPGTETVTIRFRDVNGNPLMITPSGRQNTLTEGTFPNTPTNTGLSYMASDADSDETPTLTLSGDNRFQLDASGNLQIVENSTFDYETPADRSIQLTISASNVGGGQPVTQAVTITFENANDNTPAVTPSGTQNTLTEGTFADDTNTGLSYTARDADGGTSVLSVSGDTRFQLDASGNLQIKMGSTFNYDTLADRSISLTIMAADSGDGSGSQTTPGTAPVTIRFEEAIGARLGVLTGARIMDNPDSTTDSTVPTGLLAGMFAAREDNSNAHTFSASFGEVAGTALATPMDGFSHSIAGTYGTLFYNGNSVSDKMAAYEYVRDEADINDLIDGDPVTDIFSVTVTDDNAESDSQNLTFTIIGATENPTITSGATGDALVEGTAVANTQAVYMATGTRDVDPIVWSLETTGAAAGDGALFAIDSASGAVTFLAETTPDHETKDAYTFTVVATSGTLSVEQLVTVPVGNLLDVGPTIDETVRPISLMDDVEVLANTVVYDADATADIEGATITWTLRDQDGLSSGQDDSDLFEIDASNGEVSFKMNTTPDADVKATYSFTVIATEMGTDGDGQPVSITDSYQVTLAMGGPPLFTVPILVVVGPDDGSAMDILPGTGDPETIQGGDEDDTITTGGGEDVVIGGFGADDITLDSGAAETVVYRFESDAQADGKWRAIDGSDTIKNFRQGVDKLILVDVSGDGDPINNFTELGDEGDDKPLVGFDFDSDGNFSEITFTFSLPGTVDGSDIGRTGGDTLRIVFDSTAGLLDSSGVPDGAFNESFDAITDFSLIEGIFGGTDSIQVVTEDDLPSGLTIL